MVCEVDAGVFSNPHSVSESYNLPSFASVFQTKIQAILEVYRLLRHNLSPQHNIAILTASQVAIKAMHKHPEDHSPLGSQSDQRKGK